MGSDSIGGEDNKAPVPGRATAGGLGLPLCPLPWGPGGGSVSKKQPSPGHSLLGLSGRACHRAGAPVGETAGLPLCPQTSLPPLPGLDVHQPYWPARQLDRLCGFVEGVCQAPQDGRAEDAHGEHGEIQQEEHWAIPVVGAQQETPGLVLLGRKGRPAGGKGAANTLGQRGEGGGRAKGLICCRWQCQG